MAKEYAKPKALEHLSPADGKGGFGLAKRISHKWFKKQARDATKTDCLSLQAKRLRLEERQQLLDDLIDRLLEGKVEHPDERERLMGYINLLAMQISSGTLGLIVDSLTYVSKCGIKQPDGTVKPGLRRIGAGENLSDLHDMLIDVIGLADINTDMTHDIARVLAGESWKDEHGVMRSPYEMRPEDAVKAKEDASKAGENGDIPVVGLGEGAVPEDAPKGIERDLRVAEQFIKQGKVTVPAPDTGGGTGEDGGKGNE